MWAGSTPFITVPQKTIVRMNNAGVGLASQETPPGTGPDLDSLIFIGMRVKGGDLAPAG